MSYGEIYIGDFKKGKYEGKGIYYYNNGDKYEGNIKMEKKMEKEQNIIIEMMNLKEINMLVNGKMGKKKAKEYIIFITEISMKENGKMESQKGKEYIIIIMVIYMKENGKMENAKIMENFIIKMKNPILII